ncbi:hypothetical protein Trydic_g17785 [Trypoxylus dichotomus]
MIFDSSDEEVGDVTLTLATKKATRVEHKLKYPDIFKVPNSTPYVVKSRASKIVVLDRYICTLVSIHLLYHFNHQTAQF